MKIKLITVGKLKAGPLKSLYALYESRLKQGGQAWQIDLIEISDEKGDAQRSKDKEGLAILKQVLPDKPIIILDEGGQNITSRKLALKLQDWQEQDGEVTIIIGGADGLSDKVRHMAHESLAFGKMTWPHQMVRIMLLEQLYRAKMILQNHPYHREG